MILDPSAKRTALAAAWWLLCIAAAVITSQVYGRGAFFLVVAGGALLFAIWLFWQSTTSLTGDAPLSLEEALGLGAPSAEEERKQSVLRVLKDLDYERAVGKIAEKDYHELSRKYRAEAKALLATLDQELGPARRKAELLLEERLREENLAPSEEQDPKNEQDPKSEQDDERRAKSTEQDTSLTETEVSLPQVEEDAPLSKTGNK